jgi:hypothetical protein
VEAVYAAQATDCVAEDRLAHWKKVKFRKRIIGDMEEPLLNGAEGKRDEKRRKRAEEWRSRRAAKAPDTAICHMRRQVTEAGDGVVGVSGSTNGNTSEEEPKSNSGSTGKNKEDNVEPMLWTGEQTPLKCGNEEELNKYWTGTGMPIEEHNGEMRKTTNVDAEEEAKKVEISDVEVETVATEEETEWDSSDSDAEWEDVEEPKNDTAVKISIPQHLGLDPPRLDSGGA